MVQVHILLVEELAAGCAAVVALYSFHGPGRRTAVAEIPRQAASLADLLSRRCPGYCQ